VKVSLSGSVVEKVPTVVPAGSFSGTLLLPSAMSVGAAFTVTLRALARLACVPSSSTRSTVMAHVAGPAA
jgi:hypothetical protein